MKRLLVVAIIIFSLLGGYCYATSYASSSKVEDQRSGYLIDQQGNETKIFLVSAGNPRYGVCNWNYSGIGGVKVHEGDCCFIVDVVIRNDYTTDPIWTSEDAPSGLYYNHVKLTVHLYNQQGRVDAIDVTYPINSLHGGHVFLVEPEETHSVELCLATDCKDIKQYEVYVAYVGPFMEP